VASEPRCTFAFAPVILVLPLRTIPLGQLSLIEPYSLLNHS
jgi:hypothetical protein